MHLLLPMLELQARSARLPTEAVFSGRTAGWLHGLDVPACDPIEVTLPRLACTSRPAGVSLMRSNLDVTEVTAVRGLRATSATRTVADLVRQMPEVEGVIHIETAVRRRLTSLAALQMWCERHVRYRGIGRLRRALHLAEPASESPMETRLRLLLVSRGLPRPSVQAVLRDETGMFIARADLLYADHRLVIEYDGVTHRDNLQGDNRRQNRLVDGGYRVLRFTATDIFHSPAAVVSLVRRNLFEQFSELAAPRFG